MCQRTTDRVLRGRVLLPVLGACVLASGVSGRAETPPPADPPVTPSHATGDEFADNAFVHQWVAQEAYRYFTNRVDGADLGTFLGTLAGSFGDSDDNLLEGTRDEDVAGENPAPIFSIYYLTPYVEHFCAGADGGELDDGLGGWPAAISRANWYWTNYVAPRYPSNKASAAYYLGHVAHLLTDLTVPAHVHNDDHAFGEPYEDWVAANGRFQAWFFGCAQSGLAAVWERPLPADDPDLRSLFQRTANYAEDYDSLDADGDVRAGAAPYDPGDHPTTWHRPGDVNRAGGMDDAELATTAEDLLPYAIRRVADLYRFFYKSVDATGPTVVLSYPDATDPDAPALRHTADAFDVVAAAADPESGVLRNGFRFQWRHWTGTAWSAPQAMDAEPTTNRIAFVPPYFDALYAFDVTAENGGGRQTAAATTYLRVATHTADGTPYAWLDAYGLVAGGDYEAAGLADVDGDGHAAWQEYVTGSDPTNRASILRIAISLTDGPPALTWAPNLGTARLYAVEGCPSLADPAWAPTNAASRLFRLRVRLP